MLLLAPSFLRMLCGVTSQHFRKRLGESAGVRGRFSNAAIFESPPPPAYWPPSPPNGKRTVFHKKKNSTVIPRRAIKVQSRARRGEIVYFVMPTLVGNVDQVCNRMPANASTTTQLPLFP
jgi:hypothetical protein